MSTPDKQPPHPSDQPPPRRGEAEGSASEDEEQVEDTLTLSLDELGITPPGGQPTPSAPPQQPLAKPPARPAPAKPTPPPPKAPAQAPQPKARTEPEKPTKPERPQPSTGASKPRVQIVKPAPPAPEPPEEPPAKAQPTARIEPQPPAAGPEATARLEVPSAAEATARLPQQELPTEGEVEIIPPESDDEPELPYSLQPEDLETTPRGRGTSRSRKPISKIIWFLVGALAGLCVAAWLYFHPWDIQYEMTTPDLAEAPKLIESINGVDPPQQWSLIGARYYGKDSFNKPWIYDPLNQEVLTSALSISPNLDWSLLALVSGPPLDPYTRLAWIETAQETEGETLLACRDYAFHADSDTDRVEDVSAQLLSWTLALGDGTFPFAPTVVDHPDPQVGQLLVVAEAGGLVRAFNPNKEAQQAEIWRATLTGSPVRAPMVWLDWRSDTPRLWLIAPTTEKLAVLDAADGSVAGSAAWHRALGDESRMSIAPVRLGQQGWGWLGSDGRQVMMWTVESSGAPKLEWQANLPSLGLNQAPGAPSLLTFPDPASSGFDQVVVTAPNGNSVWITNADVRSETDTRREKVIDTGVAGRLAALDLNGDGYWDLLGINEDGEIWFRAGPKGSGSKGMEKPYDRQNPKDLGTDVIWDLSDRELALLYIDDNGVPQKVSIELPALTVANLELLKRDWELRQAGI